MLLINPIYSFVFNREGLNSIEMPMLIVSSSETNDSQFFSANIPGTKLITLSHLGKDSSKSTPASETIDEADREEIASIDLNFFNTRFK